MLGALRRIDLKNTDKYYALSSNVVTSLARMSFAVALARITGAEAYADYVLLFAVFIIAMGVLVALFVAPMVTMAPGLESGEKMAMIRLSLRTMLRWSLGFGVVGLCAMPLVLATGMNGWMYVGFVLSTVAWLVATGQKGWLGALFRAKRGLVADVAGLAVPGVGIAIAAASGLDVLSAFWWANAAGGVVAIAIMGWPKRDADEAMSDAARSRFRVMGRAMATGTVAYTICSRIQPFVLGVAATAHSVSLFGAAATIIGPLRLLSMSMSSVLRPRLALHWGRGARDGVKRSMTLVIGMLGGAGLVGTALSLLIGGWVGTFVFGAEFGGLSVILPWAAAYGTAEAVGTCLVVMLQTTSETGARDATKLRSMTAGLSLLVIYPACLMWGAAGAFISLAGVEVLFLALMYRAVRRVPMAEAMNESDSESDSESRQAA